MQIGRQVTTSPQFRRGPWSFAAATALFGVFLSLFAWVRLDALEEQRLAQEFHVDAEGVRSTVQREINLFLEVLESIRDLHNLSASINPAEFGEFVDKGMMHQKRVLGAFGFAQRITRDQRAQIEQDPASPLVILEIAADGTYHPTAERDEYSILTYQTPANGLQVPIGFDFGSMPDGQAVLHRMYDDGNIALGARIPAPSFTNCFHVYAPIVVPVADEVTGNMPPVFMAIGFAAAILSPDEILERVSTYTPPRHMRLRLLDEAGHVLAARNDSGGESPLDYTGSISVADRTWTLQCTARIEFSETRRPGRANIVLAAGLLVTALLTGELLLMARRNRATEATVRRRTADLVDAKDKLEKEMQERLRLENEIIEISSREKERVGRDLHDSLGQKLTGAAMLSRALVDQLSDAPKESARKINEVIKESVAQVRRIAKGLSPVDLGEEGLVDALRLLAEETEQTCGIACSFRTVGEPRFRAGPTATHLYHIAQEAISNAVRHGKARHIAVALDAQGVLSIDDDGTGMPAHASQQGGMGLKLMRYRASMIGGSLEIEPRPEGGTRLVCRFSA